MNLDFASALDQQGFVNDWARRVAYGIDLSAEEKEMNAVADAFWKEIGRNGDPQQELAALLRKTLTPESLDPANDLLSRVFEIGNIDEFDDFVVEVAPKNTLVAHESTIGGNVNRSFIDHSLLTPTWKHLQIETDVSLQDLRRGGYRNVANLVNFAREAFEIKRAYLLTTYISSLITSGDNYVAESGATVTDTSMGSLAKYLLDVSDGSAPIAWGLSKYIYDAGNLTHVNTNKTDVEKSLWNSTGYIKEYSGVELASYSSHRKFPNGTTAFPTQTILGAAGKIGKMDMRGDLVVLQHTDNNSEKVHLKLNNYQFGYCIQDITKAAKIAIAQ